MADLTQLDRRLLEGLLGMRTGYVLDFTDSAYEAFFSDFGVDIEREEYHKYGRSKAKRMRAFWERGSDANVGKVLAGLFEYIEVLRPQNVGGQVEAKHRAIAHRLLGARPDGGGVATEVETLLLFRTVETRADHG